MGQFDRLRSEHSLQPEDIIEQLHTLLISGKLLLPAGAIGALLSALASCDVRLQRSIHPRIQFERLFNDVSIIGREFGLAV